ncbi:hypothetical protein IWQ62_001016 [Dispira parvispora]|uniref:RING-type E3 ubiquitin transferase n=1 Tax=Dispira parvispora TaxID=1520584 RepID=A0A9W8AUL9_9FUNG|nr:hypothetical protein IWQ62_001016 [Dispira parvispora]
MEHTNSPADNRRNSYWCHQCHREIQPLQTPDLTCPHCNGSFVEMIEAEDDPRAFENIAYGLGSHAGQPPTSSGPPHREPGQSPGFPAPDAVPDVLSQVLSQVFGMPTAGHSAPGPNEPTTIPGGFRVVYGSNIQPQQTSTSPSGQGDEPPRTSQTWGSPLDDGGHVFTASWSMGGPSSDQTSGDTNQQRPPVDFAAGDTLPNILAQLLNVMPGLTGNAMVGNPGDYVFGPRGLDDVITQLMEQQANMNRPRPASDEAISHLSKGKITSEELAESSECSICRDDYTPEDEVTRLPCKHFFHETCITHWLRTNGTCPICREPLEGETQSSSQDAPPSGSASGAAPSQSSGEGNQGDSSSQNAGTGGGFLSSLLFGSRNTNPPNGGTGEASQNSTTDTATNAAIGSGPTAPSTTTADQGSNNENVAPGVVPPLATLLRYLAAERDSHTASPSTTEANPTSNPTTSSGSQPSTSESRQTRSTHEEEDPIARMDDDVD